MNSISQLKSQLPGMTGYCRLAPGHPEHGDYHDTEYGFHIAEDEAIFERLTLEVFQAGLSWLICLKKRPALRAAFADYDLDQVADFKEAEISRLLADASIIRHRPKIEATIANAHALRRLRSDYGSLVAWLDAVHPAGLKAWQALFRRHFRFTGPEVTREFLASLGYLPDAHGTACPSFAKAIESGARWASRPDSCLVAHIRKAGVSE